MTSSVNDNGAASPPRVISGRSLAHRHLDRKAALQICGKSAHARHRLARFHKARLGGSRPHQYGSTRRRPYQTDGSSRTYVEPLRSTHK